MPCSDLSARVCDGVDSRLAARSAPTAIAGRRIPLASKWRAGVVPTAILLVTLLWRLPSLFDPPWVNDEGTYFAIAQGMAHGYRLYASLWENKPPAIYLLYESVYRAFGPSVLAVRLVAAAAALASVLTVLWLGRLWLSPEYSRVAAILLGMLLGVPFLEGITADAEIFLAVFAALAMYVALVKQQPVLAALLVLVAISFKAVALFDAAALGIWLLRHDRAALGRYTGALVVGAALIAIALSTQGMLEPFWKDGVLYNFTYVGHDNGGTVPWILLAKFVALILAVVLLYRLPFPLIWLACACGGVLLGGRPSGHYTVQLMAPLCICVAVVTERGRGWVRSLRSSTQSRDTELKSESAGRLLVIIPVIFLAVAALCSAIGWGLAATGHDSVTARRLQYYGNFARFAVGIESPATYRSQIDSQVNRNLAIVGRLSRLPAGRLLVWGNAPWLYPLSNRLPATPYTSLWREPPIPGERPVVLHALRRESRRFSSSSIPRFHHWDLPARSSARAIVPYFGCPGA